MALAGARSGKRPKEKGKKEEEVKKN